MSRKNYETTELQQPQISPADLSVGDRLVITTENSIWGFQVNEVEHLVSGGRFVVGGLIKLLDTISGETMIDPREFTDQERDANAWLQYWLQPESHIAAKERAKFMPLTTNPGPLVAFATGTVTSFLHTKKAE